MNKAVAKRLPEQEAEVVTLAPTDSASLMSVISKAASDPAMDVDKLERLMGLYERLTARQAEQAFNEALSAAQAEMRPVAADASNPQTKSKYASHLALDNALRPIYTKRGFALSFNTLPGGPENTVRVVCNVSCHGHSKSYQIDMPADGKGAKGGDVMTKTHATGSAVSYGIRYLLKMIFNIAVGDDDGNAAGAGDPISEEQVVELRKLIAEVGADIIKFCKYMKVDGLAMIQAKHFNAAVAALEAKRKRA